MKECPRCKRKNTDTSERCDCGYDFVTHTVQHPYDVEAPPGRKVSAVAWVSLLFGLAVLACWCFRSQLPRMPLKAAVPLFGLAGLLGVLLGIVAFVRIGMSHGKLAGTKRAVVGVVASAFVLWQLASIMHAVQRAGSREQSMHNLHQIVLGITMYRQTGSWPPDLSALYEGATSIPQTCCSARAIAAQAALECGVCRAATST